MALSYIAHQGRDSSRNSSRDGEGSWFVGLASVTFFSLLYYITYAHMPMVGTTYSGLGHHMWISNKKKCFTDTDMPTGQLVEAVLHLRFSLPRDPRLFVSSWLLELRHHHLSHIPRHRSSSSHCPFWKQSSTMSHNHRDVSRRRSHNKKDLEKVLDFKDEN